MDTKIAIAMPLVESIKMQAVISMLDIVSNAKHQIDFIFVKDTMVHVARTSAVLKSRSIDATHIMFLDSDMSVEGKVIETLLSYDKDIVGVNYHAKHLPLESVLKFQDEDGKTVQTVVPKGLGKCYAVGTGCVLIRMDVFERIEKPWFFYEEDEDKPSMTEDVWFCRQAHRKGIDVWYTTDIVAKHIGEFEY